MQPGMACVVFSFLFFHMLTNLLRSNKNTPHSLFLELGARSDPPDPHKPLLIPALWQRGLTALLSQFVSYSFFDVDFLYVFPKPFSGEAPFMGREPLGLPVSWQSSH
eukprot:1139902-Pelagomonas_calceolata.AAC.1